MWLGNYNASVVLRNAVADGIIDFYPYPKIGSAIEQAMTLIHSRSPLVFDPRNPDTYELAAHPRTKRHQEQSFPPYLQPDVADYWAIELARFTVPKGQVGFINTLEQVLFDSEGSYYPTNSSYWGNPHNLISDVDNLLWYLQIEYFDGTLPPRFNSSLTTPITRASLPGGPYGELDHIDGLWYAAQSPKTDVNLIVPGHRMVRFFMISPPTDTYRWYAGGRLRGYTQTTYSAFSAENASLSI